MGTMDVITLDDTMDNDSSLYIVDEQPAPITIEDTKESYPLQRRKRKSNERRKVLRKKKRLMEKKLMEQANWYVLGPGSNNHLGAQSEVTCGTSSNFQGKPPRSRNDCEQTPSETIVIDTDSEIDATDVIELSDDESDNRMTGTIGGELSKTVHKAQRQMATFQRRGKKLLRSWPESKKKNPPPKLALPVNQPNEPANPTPPMNQPLQETATRTLRPIVIDGSNVAFGHGSQGCFSSKGLEICTNYFINRGHTVKIFVPQFRRRHHATADTHILDKLEKDKVLIFTPSRRVNGKTLVSYDDRYIVEYATKCGGIIVTRDNYQDIVDENQEWKETINQRLLMFTWVDDMIMFPQDPLGRHGPTLDEFLSFPPEKPGISNQA